MQMLEVKFVNAALQLAHASCSHAFILPVAGTTPQMYAAYGDAEKLRELAEHMLVASHVSEETGLPPVKTRPAPVDGSINTPEFHELAMDYRGAAAGSAGQAYDRLVAHILSWADNRPRTGALTLASPGLCLEGQPDGSIKVTQRVQDGWKLVPVVPTHAMLMAMHVLPDTSFGTIVKHSVDKLPDAYRAMLAAAPVPEVKNV